MSSTNPRRAEAGRDVLCTCSAVCGPAGQMVSPRLRRLHEESQRRNSQSSSTPHPALQYPSLLSLGAKLPTKSSGDPIADFVVAGRELLVTSMDVMEDYASLETEYRRLSNEEFNGDDLVFVWDTEDHLPAPEADLVLDHWAQANGSFLQHSEQLQHLRDRLDRFINDSPPIFRNEAQKTLGNLSVLMEEHHAKLDAAKGARMGQHQARGKREYWEHAPNRLKFMKTLDLAFKLLMVILTSVLGQGHRTTTLVMKLVRHVVQLAILEARPDLDVAGAEEMLRGFPMDARTSAKQLDLPQPTTIYATCPSCCAIYPPLPPTSSKPYQERCTWRNIDSKVCDRPLLRRKEGPNGDSWRAIRRFPFFDPGAYLTGLALRPDLDPYLGYCQADVKDVSHDIWDSEFLANFRGADNKPFVGEGRLVVALAIDWFNPYGNREAKKKWSIGAVYMVCLNLPLHLRFRLENVCLIAIIPGPMEPSLELANHFLRPIVDSLKRLYEHGLWVSPTPLHPDGQVFHVMLGLLIADLLGLRQIAGFAYPAHRLFCSYCFQTKDKIDQFFPRYPTRDLDQHRAVAMRWRDAGSLAERKEITKTHGVRWSVLQELPYWDPFKQAPVDVLHCLLAVLSKHIRGAWYMNIKLDDANRTSEPFYTPPDVMIMAKAEHTLLTASDAMVAGLGKGVLVELCDRRSLRTGGKTKRQLLESLYAWRVEQGITLPGGQLAPGQSAIPFVPPSVEELRAWYEFEDNVTVIDNAKAKIKRLMATSNVPNIVKPISKQTLRTLSYEAGLPFISTKAEMCQNLIDFFKGQLAPSYKPIPRGAERSATLGSTAARFYPVMGAGLLAAVRADMERTTLPQWFKPAPKNAGDAKQGKVSSKEWRSFATVNLPITLVQLWAERYTGIATTDKQKILDNFLNLAVAAMLCTQECMTESVVRAYELHIRTYLEGFKLLYPKQSIIPYHHLAVSHLPDFMTLMGPWASWCTGPFEMFNGMIQSIPTSSKFGPGVLGYSRSARIRALPSALAGMRETVLDHLTSGKLGGMARQTQYASDYSADAVKVILHSDTSVELDEASRAVLERRFPNTRPPSSVWICKYLLRGLISFTSSTFSTRDSQVSYYGEDRSIRYGRIYSIFADCLPQHSGSPSTPNDDTKHRVYILVERYTPLQPQDAAVDPFECHPLTGPTGYNLFRTVYSSFMEALDLIEVKDVVGHIAICRTSANDRHKYAEATIITAQVDQSFLARYISPELVSRVKIWCDARVHTAGNARQAKRPQDEISVSDPEAGPSTGITKKHKA